MDTEDLFRTQDSNDVSQTLLINETSDSEQETSEDDIDTINLRSDQLNDKLKMFLDKQISSRQQFSPQNMLKVNTVSSNIKNNPTTSEIQNKIGSKETNIDILAPFIELEMCSLSKQKSVKITQKFSQLCQAKGFMTAELYHEKESDVGQKSLRDNKSTNEITQPKVVYSMADAVLEDFDNFDEPMVVFDNSNEDELKDYRSSDDEELNQSIFMTSSAETQPNQVEFLNSSLEALSQKLRSFSQQHLSRSPSTSRCSFNSAVSNVDDTVGRTLKFNEEHLKKIASNFATDDEKFDKEPGFGLAKKTSNKIEESPLSTASTSNFSGFSMASGRTLKFNEENLKKIASNFAKDDEKFEKEPGFGLAKKTSNKIEESPLSTASTSKFSGFSMASGRTLKFNEEHLKKIESSFAKDDEKFEKEYGLGLVKKSSNKMEESPISTASTSKFSGFSMASGRTLKFNEENLKKIASNFAKDDEKFEKEAEIELIKNSSHSTDLPQKLETPKPTIKRPLSTALTSRFSGFSMATGQGQKFYKDKNKMTIKSCTVLIRQSTNPKSIIDNMEVAPMTTSSNTILSGFSTASGRTMELNEDQLKTIALVFGKEDEKFESFEVNEQNHKQIGNSANTATSNVIINSTPIRVRDISKKRKFELEDVSMMCSPVLKTVPRLIKTEISKPVFVNKLQTVEPTESQEVESVLEMCMDLDDSIENIQELPKKKRCAKTKLFTQFNQSTELNSSWNDVDMELLKTVEMDNNINENVRKARRTAIETQLESIVHKEQSLCCPVNGSMFEKKHSLQRTKIDTYLEHQKPKQLKRHQITFETALDYHFNMQNYLSEEICLTNIDGISVGDGATLFMNETFTVTYNEIKSAFLNMPGVDPKLAIDKWIKNAFKFIIFKLVWLENSFEKFVKYELLTPDNVMLHLKYRYDCEIDRCLRPAIRKIIEKDDVSSKRMVLKVCDIKESPSRCKLELTDGYYSIPTCIDAPLADAVGKRKIVIGTKLIVSGAELENCESGFDPLTMPKDVKLKIHANATRKVNWDVKLGYYRNPTSLPISLDSVLPTGGVIGKLRLFVTHVYQMLYVDASSEVKVIRSEKVQNRFQNQREARNLEVVEQIFNQVQHEYETELKSRVSLLNISGSKINADTNIEDLCDLLEVEADPESVSSLQCNMTKEQLRKVEKLKEERNRDQRDDIQRQIRKLMGDIDKSISQLLKFRVVDAMNPKATALVSVWRPSEEVANTIKPGKFLEVLNSKANPSTFGNEISITVGQSSTIKIIKSLKKNNYEKFMRKETLIAEITTDFCTLNSELDIACVIVKISEEKINNFQPVYVADCRKNLLSINFWMNHKDYACEDAVKEGNVIYIKNLQWRESSRRNALISAVFANEYTTFLLNPSPQELKDKLEDMKDAIGDMDEFVESCKEKIIEIRGSKELPKDKENVKMSRNNETMNSSTSSVSSPVTLNQRRINTTGTPNLQTPDIKRRIMRLTAFDNLPPFKPMSFNNKFKNAAFKKPF
ncbi:unnamed protein product [Diamesa serratosioi]